MAAPKCEIPYVSQSVDKERHYTQLFRALAEGKCHMEVSPYYSAAGLERVTDRLVDADFRIINPAGFRDENQKEKGAANFLQHPWFLLFL